MHVCVSNLASVFQKYHITVHNSTSALYSCSNSEFRYARRVFYLGSWLQYIKKTTTHHAEVYSSVLVLCMHLYRTVE